LTENEIARLVSVKTQFGLLVKFSIIKKLYMELISNKMSLLFLTERMKQ